MTELENKKSKEGRYRTEPDTGEIEPLIEPLTDLDDGEDAIDRLLVNTGFDAEEEFFSETSSATEPPVSGAQAFEFGKAEGEAWIPLRTGKGEPVEPVDLASPLESLAHEPVFSNEEALTAHRDSAPAEDRAPSEPHASFAPPDDADEPIEPAAFDLSAAEVDIFQVPVAESASVTEEREEPPAPLPFTAALVPETDLSLNDCAGRGIRIGHSGGTTGGAASEAGTAAAEETGADTAALPVDWSGMLSAQENIQRQIAHLENKAGKTARLSYAALGLSLTALCAALAIGFHDIRARTEVQAELDRSQNMMASLEEDMNSLNEKIIDSDAAAEDGSDTSKRFADDPAPHVDDGAIAIEAPYPPPAESVQTAVKPAASLRDGNPSAPPAQNDRKPRFKSAAKTAFFGPSAKSAVAGETDTGWSVNLIAFRQFEEARKKAAEFKRKGLAVKVTKVNVKRATWYRLSVPGFKTREAASTQSAQLKKLLHLNSIWVAST